MSTSRNLVAVSILSLFLGAPSTVVSQDGRKDERALTVQKHKGALALKAKKGDRFMFLATPWRDNLRAHERRREAGGKPADGERRDYHLIVQEVAPGGDITLLFAVSGDLNRGNHSRLDTAGAEAEVGEREQQAKKTEAESSSRNEDVSRVRTVTLGRDGRVKRTAGSGTDIPPDLEPHFRFIFGPGLHDETLQVGQVYTLASLYAGTATRSQGLEKSNAIYLRFEGMKKKQGDQELARFAVVTRDDAALTPSREGSSGEGNPKKGELETARSAQVRTTQKASDGADWKAVGEVVYRTADGFLERLSVIGGLPPSKRSDVSTKGKTMSILRIDPSP